MEIKKKVLDALNKQITDEFQAAHLYLSMAAYLEDKNLKGFASWMKKQAAEENSNEIKIFDYISDRQGKIKSKHAKSCQKRKNSFNRQGNRNKENRDRR